MTSNAVADETMDSLLKEIDDEMENTISTENKSSTDRSGESQKTRSWSIPLQDIGDETMDMIVSHNTISNIMVRNEDQGDEHGEAGTVEPLAPSRKSVVFSEGVNFHEYQDVSDQGEDEQDSNELTTSWKKSSFVAAKPVEVNQSLIVEAHTDSEDEKDHEQPVITTHDLLQHTVTDLDEKLSHMLDKKRNVQRLKLMTEELEEKELESQEKEKASPIKFTLQPTKPLIPSIGNSIEETSLIHFQSMENLAGADDEIEDDDSCSEYMNEVQHSPSKIPLVNTVNINKFSITNQGREPQTRMSSGSSCCDSISDLKTTIQHDSYRLLDDKVSGNGDDSDCKFYDDGKPLENEVMVTSHPNTSRIFSVATSGEGYKSAKETVRSPDSVYSNQEMESPPTVKLLEAPVNDLHIKAELMGDEDTTQDEEQGSHKDDDIISDSGSVIERSMHKGQYPPEIPQLPVLTSSHSASKEISLEADSEEDNQSEIGFTDLHDVASSVKDVDQEKPEKVEISSVDKSEKSIEIPRSHDSAQTVTSKSLQTNVEGLNPLSSQEDFVTTTSRSSSIAEHANETAGANISSGGKESKNERKFSILPPFAPVGSIFLDDPFVDDFETSGESIDLTKSVKPSNYLSIWHMQEEDIRATSPAISSNSQFSRCTDSTNTSASVNSNLEHNFKFKPRVISRSKYYYPESRQASCDVEDSYVISNFETALDPLRRNTIISRRIQENIKSRRKLYPSMKEVDENDAESLDDKEIVTGPAEEHTVVDDVAEERNEEIEKQPDHDFSAFQLDLLPCLPDAKLKDEFMSYLEAVSHDNRSILNHSEIETGKYNVWDHQSEFEVPTGDVKKTISMDVINKLLEEENHTPEPVAEESVSLQPPVNLAILKTPVKEVSVGRGLSLKGYDALVSTDVGSERHSALFVSPSHDEDGQSPVKKTHVDSPFKVKHKKPAQHDSEKPDTDFKGLAIQSFEPEEKQKVVLPESVHAIESDEQKSLSNEEQVDQSLPDRGNLYLRLNNVANILIHGITHHKAQFAIEFDNGKDVVQTAWDTLANDKKWEINQEFEVILDNDLDKIPKLIITLKCRYESPKNELKEIVERVPVGRKFPFGKSKYQYQKRFVQTAPKKDEWDYLFARDGSFGRCEIPINKDFLKEIKFQSKPLSFTLINEWARKSDSNSTKKIHELPRRPPYAIGTLNIEACHLERTSPFEKLPKTLAIAHNIISKYRAQQAITKEGFLLQEGGDVEGSIQRRFFKLQGNNMLGYHEMSRQAKVDINLLKVVNVFGPGDVPKEGERNLTDLVLFSGCFHLVFDNGERIAFSTESAEEEAEWFNKIKDVVDLNRCHQPWVKYFNQNYLI